MKLLIIGKTDCPNCKNTARLALVFKDTGMVEDVEDVHVDTEDHLALFCKSNLNPNSIPGVFLWQDGDFVSAHPDDMGLGNRTFPRAGLQTMGRLITAEEIENLLKDYGAFKAPDLTRTVAAEPNPFCTGDRCRL